MRSRWVRLLLLLAVVNGAIFVLLPRLRYRSIVIHHSASRVDNYESIREMHVERGWSDAAYHLILSNGSTEIPAGHLESTGRHRNATVSGATGSRWCNVTAIHLCIVGNYEEESVPDALQPAVAHAIAALQQRYGIPDHSIELHRECSKTLCPGQFVDTQTIESWLPRASETKAGLRGQHRRIIDSGGLVPWRLTPPMLQVMALASFALLLTVPRWPGKRPRRRRRRPKQTRS